MYYKLRKTTHGLSSVGFLALASVMGTNVNAEETVVSDDTTKTEAVRNYISQMKQPSTEDTNPYVAEILKNTETADSVADTPVTSETDSLVTSETDSLVTSETVESVTSETETSVISETNSLVTSETPATSEIPVTSETITESVVETSTPIVSESISVGDSELPTDQSEQLILEHITVPEPEDLVSDPQPLDATVESPNGEVDDMRAAVISIVEASTANNVITSLDDLPDDLSAMVGDRLVFRFTPTSKTTPPKISLINTTDTSNWNLVSYTIDNNYAKPSDRIIISNPYTFPKIYPTLPAETTELDAQLTQEYAGSITYPSGILQLTLSDLDPSNGSMRGTFAAYGWTSDLEFAKRIIRLNYIETMHLLLNRYSSEYNKDPYAVFDNIYHISTQQFAQVKAAKMRVDAALNMASITDATTLNYYNDFQKYYKRLEAIYNGYNNDTYMPTIRWEKAINSYSNTSTDELNKFLKALPLQIRQLAVDITVIDEAKAPDWAGLAYGTREIALNPLYVNVNNISLIVAHEMGHVVDFASTVYDKNAGYKVVNSFSQTPEFRDVWRRGFVNYDPYFRDDPEEGFAEGFAQWLAVEYGGASRADMDRVLPGVYDYFNKLANRIFFAANNYPSTTSTTTPTTPPPTFSTTDPDITLTHREAILFTTTYVADVNMEVGRTQIRSYGKNGEKVTLSSFKDGVETKTVTRTEPINQVIAVGTKPTMVTSPIPFETRYTQDASLEANTSRTIIAGVEGVQTVTTTYKVANGVAVPLDKITSTTKQPTHQWVSIGTKPTVVTNTIPFKTTYIRDDYATAGSTRVTKEGVNGSETITTTYTLSGSTAVPMSARTTSAPIDKVIAVGTKPTSVTSKVPFTTVYQRDDNMTAGTERVFVNGKDGTRTVNVTYDLVDGKAVPKESVTSSTVVNEVVAIGTKPVTRTTNVAFGTDYVRDDNLAAGQTRVVREGVNGVNTVKTTYEIVTGKAVAKDTVTNTNVVNKVIAVGTKPSTIKMNVAFKTIYQRDDNLAAGQTRVIKEGVNGVKETVTTYQIVDGKAVGTQSVKNTTVVDEIVAVGTKPVQTEAVTKKYTTIYIPSYELDAGQTRVKTKGVNEATVTTTTYDIVDGKAVPKVVKSVSNMVPEVIEVGVKATSTITHTDFATKYVADSNLSAGTKQIQTLGYRGYTVTTTTYKVVDGKAVPVVSTQTAKPIDEVIVIGTKPRVSVKYVPYKIEYIVNPTMAPGEVKVVQNGTLGEIITTTTYTIVNGQAVGTDVVTTKPAQNYIVHAGR